MKNSIIWKEIESAQKDMLFHNFFRTILVRDRFWIDQLFTFPDRAHSNVQEKVFFFQLEWVVPAIFGFNFIKAHKIVIVSILFIFELELLVKFDVAYDWSMVEIIFILEVDAFRNKILWKDEVV